MKRYEHCIVIIAFCLSFANYIHAQDIEVKKFEPMTKDQTATVNPRKDINGTVCGLVKVALKEPGAEFEGNVMGDVQYTGNEYLVYLPNGTKRLGIKHPDYLPTTIVFADYGTKRIASSTTYELKVKTNKKQAKVDNSKKGMAVFNIKPSNAMLLIDGQIADGSGGAYTLSLPYGTHYYTVKLKDFSINNQSVQIDKNAKNIDIDLTEFFAIVRVNCKNRDAEISINGESVSMGHWNGLLVPGKCTVDVTKKGYHPLSKTIELHENDTIVCDFQEMKRISGILQVNYEPNGSEVFVNGEKVGNTPYRGEFPVGEYAVEVKKDMYLPYKSEVRINDGQEQLQIGSLKPTQLKKLFIKAESGDGFAQRCLADFYEEGSDNLLKDENYWEYSDYALDAAQALREDVHIKKDKQKSLKWLKKTVSSFESMKDDPSDGNFVKSTCYRIMKFYLLGDGVKQDYTQSFYWAGRAGHDGEYWLAWHYFYGRGTQKNTREALEHLNKSIILVPEFSSSYEQYSNLNIEILNKVGYKLGNGDILDQIDNK